ncbi:hypothetical protein D0C17_13285 [Vibrio cholerae]|nr:hypothetical protein [Vibrio cholerae]KFE28807.1 hypothetical protein DN30_471 [Vibrio cholerae]GIB00029.1 hypothetical protein VCSRO136_2493 [Vibrio cholerae]GIB16260.1 hypothetical protein VCSRO90_2674 [Vibrio cholerae]HAS7807650.1 hypothetical protein [Vibrio cholerae]
MCGNCKHGICQGQCIAGQQKGYTGEVIPSETIKHGEISGLPSYRPHPHITQIPLMINPIPTSQQVDEDDEDDYYNYMRM